MNRIFIASLLLLFVSSVSVLFVGSDLLAVLLLLAGMACLLWSIFKDHSRLCWLPLYILNAEMQLFYATASGLLLLFYYILLVMNLIWIFLCLKRYPYQQMELAGFCMKVCFVPFMILNFVLFIQGNGDTFLALAYSMVIITSAYTIGGLYLTIDEPGMTPAKFLVPTIALCVPVVDLFVSGYYAWKVRESL